MMNKKESIVMSHLWENNDLIEIPAYSPADAARYLGVSYTTLHYWIAGRGYMRPLIHLANDDPPELSFANLLECHILKALTGHYKLAMRALRSGIETLTKAFGFQASAPRQTFQN